MEPGKETGIRQIFRQYPYWGRLLLAILLWCACGYHYYTNRLAMQPRHMTRLITRDLHKREKAVNEFTARTALTRKLFTDTLTQQEATYINKLPVYVYAWYKDTISYWNNNDFIVNAPATDNGKPKLIRNERGAYLQECFLPIPGDTTRKLVVLIPVTILYNIENDYLRSRFVAADYIPISTQVLATPASDALPCYNLEGKPVLYLQYRLHDIPRWIPDIVLVILLIASLIASISWIQLMAIYVSRKVSPFAGLMVNVVIIGVCRALLYIYGLPFNIDGTTFFSPRLYASNQFLPSLGDLFINTLCVLWIVVFVTRHIPYKNLFSYVKPKRTGYILAFSFFVLLTAYLFFIVDIIRKLVIDSSISFDISHFYSISFFTIVGLFIIGIITGVSCIIIYIFNSFANSLVDKKQIKYLLAALAGIVMLVLWYKDILGVMLVLWLVLFIVLLDVRRFTLVSDLFEPQMVFWAIFICTFSTGILQYFNHQKEQENRKIFIEQRIAPQQDIETEVGFDRLARAFAKDKTVRNFFYKPTLASRRLADNRLEFQYLSNPPLNKYQPRIYFFDNNGLPLFNKDTANYNSLVGELNESANTSSSFLFYKESILDKHYYLAYVEISNDTTHKILGQVFIELETKKAANETVYPELLQPGSKPPADGSDYAYAIYVNNKLVTQTNSYPFPTYLRHDTLKDLHQVFIDKTNASELWYKVNDKRTVAAVHYHNVFIESVTLFSYMFGVQVLLAAIILLYQLYLSSLINPELKAGFTRLTLRRRVHFSMLAVVLLSFIIIGFVTILFFTNEYKTTNEKKLEHAMQFVKQSVQDYLKKQNAYASEPAFDAVSRSASFKYFINNLAGSQNIDINVYDDNGTLDITSQEDIYDKSLLARIMRPDAFYQLQTEAKSIVVQDEKIGDLPYLSCYIPLRDEQGVTLGYVNVPFFSSERELNYQISNIVITLINLYAFVFLLSGLFTVFITRWLTRTFNIIIRQFGRLNLQRNERIEWPYDDEIGMLVREYNKMVKKVEENAAMLAQSERESAWREMARQVAHEIKNPLTPMKLNIQYLQQALKNGHPNIIMLADRVSASLVEQIDNLSYIASEFSNFAKMPEARPEDIELGELLDNATELYCNDPSIDVKVTLPGQKVFVNADKSQLLRVCTNLLENARQAIPEDRKGVISIRLKTENDNAIITITDNGMGIPEDVIPRIFQPYFTTKSSGTGLGLAMTKKIIEFWKGAIWFETEEGRGTVFFIKLPVINEAKQ